jgi:putative heme transporter
MQPVQSGTVPASLRLAAALSWRVLLIAAAVIGALLLFSRLQVVFIPVIAALFVCAVLRPPWRLVNRLGAPPMAATWIVLLGAAGAMVGLGWLTVPSFTDQLGDLELAVRDGLRELEGWLATGPLGLPENTLDRALDEAQQWLSRGDGLAGSVITGARLAVEIIAGILLAITLIFFFLKDGDTIWGWAVGLFPQYLQSDVDAVGRRAWGVLGSYLVGTAIVAFVDAVLIGLGLFVLGVPLAMPLSVLVFVGGFFPLVGAFVTGVAAALVTLVTNGPISALIVIAIVIAVQQIEGDVLQPVVVGRAVRLHPVAILLSLAIGGGLGGIVGAFLAVPTAAVVAVVGQYVRERRARMRKLEIASDSPNSLLETAGGASRRSG